MNEKKPLYNGPHSEFHDLFWKNLYERLGENAPGSSEQVAIGRAISVALRNYNTLKQELSE